LNIDPLKEEDGREQRKQVGDH